MAVQWIDGFVTMIDVTEVMGEDSRAGIVRTVNHSDPVVSGSFGHMLGQEVFVTGNMVNGVFMADDQFAD